MKSSRVAGHTLPREGRIRDWDPNGSGLTRCSCGAKSPVLPSTAARQRWHRDHKRQVVAERDGGSTHASS